VHWSGTAVATSTVDTIEASAWSLDGGVS